MMLLTLNSLNNIARFFTLLLIFVFVLAITYFTTRFIANYQKGKMQGGNITIIETARIAQDKYIQIIKIGTKYIAVAVSKNEVSFLTELSEKELDFHTGNENAVPGFSDILNRMKAKKDEKEDTAPQQSKLKVFHLAEGNLKEESADCGDETAPDIESRAAEEQADGDMALNNAVSGKHAEGEKAVDNIVPVKQNAEDNYNN